MSDDKEQERRKAIQEKLRQAGYQVEGGKVSRGPGKSGSEEAKAPKPAARSDQPKTPAGQLKGRSKGSPPEHRPLPPPPARRSLSAPRVTATVTPEVQSEIDNVYRSFTSLEAEAQLSTVYEEVGQVEAQLTQLPLTLDSLRTRGYVHSGKMESQLAAFQKQWAGLRPRVESTLADHVKRLNVDLDQTSQRVAQIASGNAAAIAAGKAAVEGLDRKIDAARNGTSGLYSDLRSQLYRLEQTITQAGWIMDQLDASPDIQLRQAEGPVAGVKAQWHRDGKEGPEGILYLTDQRLLFEQKEEIVTKKVLGLFKKESEKIHELLLDIEVAHIESVAHSEEGGFLGMGKADILELTLSAKASVSRARFHLKGQDSSDWAAYLKRVQSGDINRDRHEAYQTEVAESAAVTFPAQCPNCMAAVPTPPRGVRSVTCEYCGMVINPA